MFGTDPPQTDPSVPLDRQVNKLGGGAGGANAEAQEDGAAGLPLPRDFRQQQDTGNVADRQGVAHRSQWHDREGDG